MAQRLGVTEPTFYRWKNGESTPDFEKIEELAKLLGVQAFEFYRPQEEVRASAPIKIKQFTRYLEMVPQEIYDLAQSYSPEDPVWGEVRDLMEVELEIRAETKARQEKA